MMTKLVTFTPPRGMLRIEIARTFTAYIVGSLAFSGLDDIGPFECSESKDHDWWQLDPSNDFRLRFFEDGTATLSCRYNGHLLRLETMLKLFTLAYGSVEEQRQLLAEA